MNAHARLSCSGSPRWEACSGSPRMEAQFPQTSSAYAEEGTRAHALFEQALLCGANAADVAGLLEDADEEMQEHVQAALDWVRNWVNEHDGCRYFPEIRVNPGESLGRADLWGTADFIAIHDGDLLVADLKYGAGIAVDATDNTQARLYALGALHRFDTENQVERVHVAILQPRAYHEAGAFRVDVVSREDLLAFAEDMQRAAEATDNPDAPLSAGEHCRFCRAAGACPELAAHSRAAALQAFSVLERPLDANQVAALLCEAGTIRGWLKALEEYALKLAMQGVEIPGWQLKTRRGNRRWMNAEEALATLAATYPVDPDVLAPRVLISPAQVEKTVKAATRKKPNLSGLVYAPDLAPRLAPDGSPGSDAFSDVLTAFEGL